MSWCWGAGLALSDGLQIAHLLCVFSPVIPGRWPLGDSAEDSCAEAARDCKWTEAVRILSLPFREPLSTLGRRHCEHVREDFWGSRVYTVVFFVFERGWYSDKGKSIVISCQPRGRDLDLLTHTQGLSKCGWFHIEACDVCYLRCAIGRKFKYLRIV